MFHSKNYSFVFPSSNSEIFRKKIPAIWHVYDIAHWEMRDKNKQKNNRNLSFWTRSTYYSHVDKYLHLLNKFAYIYQRILK